MSAASNSASAASSAIQPVAGGALATQEALKELASSLKEKSAKVLSCRGCGKSAADLKLYVCCQHADGAPKPGDALAFCHSQCLDCFKVRPLAVHMQAPGSMDKCRYCVEDKASSSMGRSAPVGDPLKRPRENEAFNELGAYVRQHNADFDKLQSADGEGVSQGAGRSRGRRRRGRRARLP